MFKDHESPISLFSFQDIITCLTGIMLFFVLILAIKLLEVTKMLEQQSPYRAEIAEWRERNELLKRQLREMTEDIRSIRRRLAGAKREDRATLSIAKFRLERELKELKRRALRSREALKAKEAEKLRRESRKKQLERESEELKRAEDKLRSVKRQNRDYRENIERIRGEIRKRRHSVDITVDGDTDKSPVVLECSRDRIRIVELPGKKTTVIARKGPFASEMVEELCRSLGKYPPQKYYFALLIKPSAAEYARYLERRLAKSRPGIEMGSEPILESEECD